MRKLSKVSNVKTIIVKLSMTVKPDDVANSTSDVDLQFKRPLECANHPNNLPTCMWLCSNSTFSFPLLSGEVGVFTVVKSEFGNNVISNYCSLDINKHRALIYAAFPRYLKFELLGYFGGKQYNDHNRKVAPFLSQLLFLFLCLL